MTSHNCAPSMKGVGKIGSALAAFEDNIAKNQGNEVVGRSFLTTLASNPGTPKKAFRSISKQHASAKREGGIGKDLQLSGHSKKVNMHICPESLPLDSDHTSTTLTTTDDSTMKNLQQPLLNSQLHNAASPQKARIVRKVANVRSRNSIPDGTRTKTNSPTKISLNDMILNESSHRRRQYQPSDAATIDTSNAAQFNRSPKENKENDYKQEDIATPLPTSKIRLSGKSPLQKIAATIKRVNSSNSFREAATAAAKANDRMILQKSPFSRSSVVSNSTTATAMTKLSDYVDNNAQRSGGNVTGKSVTSLPITSHTTKSAFQQSFSSLPVLLPSRGIAVAARRSSITMGPKNVENASGEMVDAATARSLNPSMKPAGTEVPFPENQSSSSSDMEMSRSDYDEIVATCAALSLGIVAVEERATMHQKNHESHTFSSVMSSGQESKAESEAFVSTTKKKPTSSVDAKKAITRLSDYVHFTEQMNRGTEKSVMSLPITSVTTRTAFQESFSSLPVLPPLRGIAVAARRSSIIMGLENVEKDAGGMIGKEAANLVCDSKAGFLSGSESPLLDIPVSSSTDMEYGPLEISPTRENSRHSMKVTSKHRAFNLSSSDHSGIIGESLYGTITTPTRIAPTGIAKAARRSSVELMSRADYDEIVSFSGITTISEDSTMESWKADEHDQNSNDGSHGRRRPRKSASNLSAANSSASNTSLLTLDLHRCPKKIIRQECRKVDDDLFESFSSEREEIIFLPRRSEVVGILRIKPVFRNRTRHVKFADQQPDGGRRMSFQSSVKNDSLPVRPRRSNNFELDRLRNLRQRQQQQSTSEPFHFMSLLAATTIQASVRRWIQWKSTRPLLLTRKLVWIEENRLRDIARIQQQKWEMMEGFQSEIIERERRLEAQVSLAEKLCDHLKRDTALVRNQTKKLKEFSITLTVNNNHFEQSVHLNRDNFVTANVAVECLREQSENLLVTSKKYASRIDKLQDKIQFMNRRVELESHTKLITNKVLNRILRLLKHQGFFLEPNGCFGNVITHAGSLLDLRNLGPSGFDLTLGSSANANCGMSACSEITSNSMHSSDSDFDQCYHNESVSIDHAAETRHCENLLNVDEIKETQSDDSFASYSEMKNEVKRQMSIGSTSVGGNSFASYGTPEIATKVAFVQNNTMSTEHTIRINKNDAHGAAVPPRRMPSTNSFFDAIDEELTLSDESMDSQDEENVCNAVVSNA